MHRVVIAESEAATRKKLEKALREEDLQLDSVTDGRTVLQKVKAEQPDLVLLDLMMPGLDGMEVLKRLRVEGETPQVVMLVDKSEAATAALDLAMDLGADDYIAKPVDTKDVLVTVRRALMRAVTRSRRQRVAAVPLRELHDAETGRIDARAVAEYLGLPLQKLTDALEVNYQTVYKTPDAVGLQRGLAPIKRSLELISQATSDRSEARAWLNNPHPHLGGRAPIDLILSGRAGAIVTMLENALTGIPG